MKKFLPRLAITAAALVCVSAAQAAVLTFDQAIDPQFAASFPLMGHLDEFQTQGFWVDTFSTKAGAVAGDFVGALVDGTDLANTCAGLVCPAGNATKFLAAVNDGLPDIGMLDGSLFKVASFDASFIAASGDVVQNVALLLRVEGYSTTALLYQQDFLLPGPVSGGYTFATYTLSAANAGVDVNDVAFRGFYCTTANAGSCTRALDKAQFAIDNLNAVPEPAEWLLMGLGLVAVGALARRRSTTAA